MSWACDSEVLLFLRGFTLNYLERLTCLCLFSVFLVGVHIAFYLWMYKNRSSDTFATQPLFIRISKHFTNEVDLFLISQISINRNIYAFLCGIKTYMFLYEKFKKYVSSSTFLHFSLLFWNFMNDWNSIRRFE